MGGQARGEGVTKLLTCKRSNSLAAPFSVLSDLHTDLTPSPSRTCSQPLTCPCCFTLPCLACFTLPAPQNSKANELGLSLIYKAISWTRQV